MSFSAQNPCRCGYTGEGEHPCHRCINKGGEVRTGQRHFIAYPTCLSGMQMKMGAYETFACAPCLEEYRTYVKEAAKRARDEVQAELREVKP